MNELRTPALQADATFARSAGTQEERASPKDGGDVVGDGEGDAGEEDQQNQEAYAEGRGGRVDMIPLWHYFIAALIICAILHFIFSRLISRTEKKKRR